MSQGGSGEKRHRVVTAGQRLAAAGVAVVMLLIAFSLWTVIPLAWLWIGSQLAATQFPALGPYAVVLFGVIFSIIGGAWVLGLLNEIYLRLTGTHDVVPIRLGWLRSLGDTSGYRRPLSVIETVIIGSVLLSMLALVVWFFTLAGSPLPG